jgi:hypothetical protein
MEWRSANTVGTKAEIKLSTIHKLNTVKKIVGLKSISTVNEGFTLPGITKLSNK